MRKILGLALFGVLALGAAATATYADEDNSVQVGKDTFLSTGMKLWFNTWQTNLTGNSGQDWVALTAGPVIGYIPNIALKHKSFLVAMSYMGAGDYNFPAQTFYDNVNNAAKLETVNVTGQRQEFDFNLGYYLCPTLAVTVGYKGVTEDFKVNSDLFGNSENKVYLNGGTLGLVGSAPIGRNFSVYGSGVGGLMEVTYTPASTYADTAEYEASEIGLAWRPGGGNFSTTLGYKFQLMQTSTNPKNNPANPALDRNEVTRGFMLGANYIF